ncbi:MAG: hypothetical protein JWM90_2062 [Thermoleophilia bacterium]|nr:hypothetical protein [Thermoleophilia bacterium]
MNRVAAMGIEAAKVRSVHVPDVQVSGVPVPTEDIAFLRGLTSTPLIRKTTPRFDGPAELVVQGHAIRNTFIPVGTNLDEAAAAAMEMTSKSRDMYTGRAGALRATGVVQSNTGNLYLVGLHEAAWNPSTLKRSPLELRDGVVKPEGITDRTIPPGLVEANQFGSGNIYLEEVVKPYFGQPRVEALEPGVIGIASSNRFVPIVQGRGEPVPGTWPTKADFQRAYPNG